MEDNKRKLYDALSAEYDLGTFEQFSTDIQDADKRKKLYDATINDYDFGDFDSFSNQLGLGSTQQEQPIDKSQYTFTERELGLGGYQLGQPIPIIEKMRRKETEAGAGTPMGDDIYRTKEGQYTRTEVPFRTIEYPSLGMAQMAARGQQREDTLAAYRSAYNRLEAPGEVDERTLIEWGNNMDNAPTEQKNLYTRIMGKDAANRVDLDAVMRSYDETKKSLEGVEDPEGLAAYLIMPAEQRVKLPEAERKKYEAALEEVEKAELAGNVNELHDRLSSLMEQQRRSDIKMREEYEENRGVGGFLLDALLQLPVAENPRMQGTIPSSQLDISPEGVHSNEQNAALTAAGRKWNEMKHIIDAAANGDIFDGLDKALSSADTWSSDQMLRDGMAIQRVVDKFDKNGREALTENEKALLDAIALNVAVSEVYGDEISNWYKGGEMIGEMVPYVIEMLMNPLSGVGRKAAEKITRAALKKYGKELVKKKAGRFALKRGAAKLGASVAGATGMALTTGLPAVGADIQRRMLGDATYGYDNDGNIEYTGHVGGEDLGTSAYKAVTSRMLDNVSEMLGAGYAKIPFKWLQKVGKGTKVLGWIDNLANSKTVKQAVDFMEKANWHGPIEEFLEEVHVGLINPVLVGDQSWEEFFTADNLATIAIGVAVPGAAISALNTIGGAADGAFKVGARERWKMQTAAARGAQLWKDNPGEWRALEIELSHDSMEDIEKELKKVYNNPDLTPEQKKVALEYAIYSLQWRTTQGVKEAFNEGKKFIDPMLRDIYGNAYEQRIAPMEANKAYRTMTEAEKNAQEILGIGEKSVDEWLNGRTAEEAARSSKEKLAAIKAYQTAKLDFEGRRDRFIAERDIAYMESDRSIQAHDNNGMVYATQYEGQPVYITGGDVVLLESGKIDFDRSSESLYVKFPDGHVEMIAPEIFSEVFTEDRTEDLKAAKRAEIDERWKAEFDTAEVLARQQEVEQEKRESGVVFDMTDPEGSHRVEILNEGNGMADILLDGKEEQIPTEELNRWKQEAGIQTESAVADDVTDNGTPMEGEANVAPTGDNVTPVAPVENNEPAPVELPDVPDFFRLGGKNYSVASRNNDGSVDVMVDGKRETLPAGTDYSTHMPTDKKGEVQYEQMPVERTHEYFVRKVKDDEARAEMIEKRRKKAETERKKFDKKPDPGIDPDAYEAKMTQWEADKKAAQAKVDYWKEVAKRDAEITRSETREAVNNIKPDVVEETADEFIANQLAGIKITPESFKRETGLSNAEQAQLVGVISNDGVSVERAAEIILENYDSELKALGFTGDVQDVRDAIISILSQGNPRGYAKRGYEARVQDDVDQQRADAEAWAKGAFDMKLEELYLYEETILPRIMRDYEGFDENEYYSNLAENNGYDTTRESESIGRGGELLQGEQPVPAGGTPVVGQRNEGGAVSDDVQGGGQNGVAQEEVPVNEPVGNSEQLSSSEIPNNQSVAGLEGYSTSEILDLVKGHIFEALGEDVRIVDMRIIGSRTNGTNNADSDLDVLVEYEGDISEDSFFNAVNDEEGALYIDGIRVDINPITKDKSGSIEQWMNRNKGYSKAEGNAPGQSGVQKLADRILDRMEEKRRIPLRERARELEAQVGVKANIIESLDEVKNREARERIAAGEAVAGWYSGGQVYLYMPNIKGRREIELTYVHEVVAHHGVKKLLGERFNEFLDGVWNMMSEADRARMLAYVGANENPNLQDMRAAADEYVAELAEKMNLGELEQSTWDKIVDWFKELLENIGFENLTKEDIESMLKASYSNLRAESGKGKTVSTENDFRARMQEDAESKKIFETAKEVFGTTYDMREAGYILPDGTMLDFSGKHQVRGVDNSFLNGGRTVDHREIEDIAYDFDENPTGVSTDMGDFLDRGAIRIDYNVGAVNLNTAPTAKQKALLKRLIERNDGDVTIDFGKGWDTEHYAEYESARASRVLGDIDRYYSEGIKPGGNTMFRISRTPQEFDATQAEAVEKRGIVTPGLNEAVVNVVDVPRHDFTGNLKEARAKAKEWAIENYTGKEFDLPQNAGKYVISKNAIGKYLDKSAFDKSENAAVHLSVLKELPNVISNSIEAEIHADYSKEVNGERSAENGVNRNDLLVHRIYGAVNVDGKTYRVKTTIHEFRDANTANTPHSYEVTKIELIEDSTVTPNDGINNPLNRSINSISATKLLEGVEKSYDKGKKVLDESENSSENPQDAESGIRFRKVEDPVKIAELEAGEKMKVYRAMQVIDGKLYPPMSAKVDGKLREPIELGVWEEAEERPELADDKGYFKLDKGNKKSLKARYNPYIHTSTTPLNDQFSEAQERPNLVTVEVEIPVSELTSGYKAEKAKDAVGRLEWKAGVVQGKLSGTRTVILSRWDKPVRIVPDSEVADVIVEMFGDREIVMPSNVVTPSLRAELEKRGVPFVETNNQGKPVFAKPMTKEEARQMVRELIVPFAKELREDQERAQATEDSGTRFRIANENQEIFVSNAQRAVEGIQQNKATAEQWIAMLKKNGGLKAGEDATEEEKVIIDSVNRIVDFINNGREEERADGRRAGGGYAERSTQENRRGQDEEVRNSQETGENTQAEETRFRTVEETTDGSIDDVPAQPLTLMERIANSLLEVSAKNKENLELRASALRTFGRDVNRVLSLMKAQREYDKSTVDTLVKLAKMYFKNAQLLGEVDTYTMGRVLSLINNVVGKRDVTASAAKLMDILLDAHTKALAGILDKAEKVKAKKVNAAGVEVMGRLDKYGQRRVDEYRAAKEMTPEKLEEAIYDSDNRLAELEQRVREELGLPEGDVDQTARDYTGDNDAVNMYMDERARLEGLVLAREYKESIQRVQEEIKDLKKELKQAEEDYRLGNIDGKSLREFRKSVAEAIMESKAGLIEGYHSLIYKFQENTKESSKRAKAFAQVQIDRAREIQHNANSDMQGIPADTQGKYPERFNSSVARALMAPMATFQGMMKKVGEKNVEGKGYLYERFVPQATMASDNEFRGKVAARVMIESRLKEIFGKKMTIAKFMKSLRKDGVTIEYREGNEMKAFALTRGQMLYIYMVNKMADGQMKLRRMGITDDVVAGLMTKLPEEAVQFADWAQDVLLKGLRGKYNAVHERVFGAPMAAIENYFPIKIRKEARGEKGDVSEVGQEGKPSTVTGSIIKRTKNATAIDLSADAMQVLMEHIDDMEHWAAFAEFNRDLNVLLNYKHFQNQVKNMTSVRYGSGTELWKNFKRTAQIVSGTYRPSDSSFDRFVQNITKGVTRAKINFRVFTAIKQLLSAPAFWTDASVKNLAYCYVNPKGSFEWAKENLPGFAERWQGRTMGNEKLLKSDSDWEIWRNETVEKATRWGMTPNAFIDALTVAQGARAVYMTKLEQFKKAGYTEQRANEKALQAAAEAYNESQQSSKGVYLSPLQVEGTAMAAMVSTFKNSNFGYTRKTAQAAANIKRKMRKGYKEETIAFMTKQMMRDGLSEENAKRFAEKVYYKSIYRDAANVAMFGFGLNLLWEAGGMAIYLFLGDDDEEKEKMKEEIAMRAALGVLQGIPFGDTMISAVTAVKEGDSKYLRLPELIAVTDIKNLAQVFDYDTVRAANDVLNILVSMGVGVTPQVFTDVLVAIADIEDFSVEELGMFAARLVNAPQSNLDRLMVDDAMENSAINAEEIMRRYAEYKKSKNAPITQFFYPEEEEKKVIERYEKRFEKLLDERLENVVEDNDAYDLFYKGADARRKSELAKMRQKYLAEDKAKALEKLDSKELVDMVLNSTKEANKDINEEYFNLTNAEDEDTAFIIKSVKKALDDLKEDGKLSDKERGLLSSLNSLNYAINKAKRLMEQQPERAQEHMNNIRELRAKAMELINNYRKDE